MSNIAYTRTGDGPLLVCHPGGPGFSGATLGDLGRLADNFELLIIDPRGTGDSPRPANGAYRQDDYVEDLENLREQLGLEAFDLLGHSHGGFVAMSYGAAHPERVRRLVLVATAPRFSPEYDERIAAIWKASSDSSVAEALSAREQRMGREEIEDGERMRLRMLELRLYFRRAEGAAWLGSVFGRQPPNVDALHHFNTQVAPRYDIRDDLSRIDASTVAITGELDFFGPPANRDIVNGISDARSVVLPDAGHFVWFDEPDRFREEVTTFLRP
jgi:pimeloyl-ACP methyl ester carboxylesterase